jgi:Gpi18-like mannosyltransferase
MLKQSLLQAIKTHKHLIIAGVVAYLVLLLVMPNFGHAWDCACWGMWATRMNSHGIASAYTEGSTVNYLPLYLYVLRAYAWLVGTEQIYPYIYTLKIVTLLFDVGSAMIISSYFKHQKRAWQYVIFTLLNIGFIYNTIIWNQVDGIWSFFVLAAFTMGYRKHLSGSMLLFILAINVKLQAIIFLPLLGLMWLPLFNWRSLTKALLISLGVQLLVLAPFIAAGVAGNITDVISGSVDYYQSVSMNAFNFWYLVLDGDLMFVKDDILIGGLITYKQAGLLMFFGFSFLVLLPIIKDTWLVIIKKQVTQLRLSQWVWSMTLIPLIFFYFNTQMHERYIHPAIGFATLLAFSTRQYGPWLLMSIAYALSLESICKFLELNNYGTLIFHPDFLAGLYGVSLVWWVWVGGRERKRNKRQSS